MTNPTRDTLLAGFRRNYLDSLLHALSHYSELSSRGDNFHDKKWAVLSVAHASEVYCNLLLADLFPRRPRGQYPALAATKRLLRHNSGAYLSPGETRIMRSVFPPLAKLRNKLMHEPVIARLEIVDATVALLALLYLSRRRMRVSVSNLFAQDPPIEIDVLDELKFLEQDEWFSLAEQLDLEDYGDDHLRPCENCGRFAVTLDLGCHACFEDPRL